MTAAAGLEVLRRASAADWVQSVVEHWDRAAAGALARSGRFAASLAGGRTPRRFYEALSQAARDWSRVRLFLGDERCVPADHPESNFRMIREALIDPSGVPEANVCRWRTELGPADAAADYEARLRAELGIPPALDLALLGIGNDGHTASLFPGTAALEVRDRLAAANEVPALGATRLTLTFPALMAAREVWFLTAGPGKDAVLRRLAEPGCALPAARLGSARRCAVFHCVEPLD